MKIEYTKQGDYLIPNLTIKSRGKKVNLGKYGLLRLDYIKQHKRGFYTSLKMKDTLLTHLLQVQDTAIQRVEDIVKQLAEKESVTEALKTENQMEWVGIMNNLRNVAEEIVFNEIICN